MKTIIILVISYFAFTSFSQSESDKLFLNLVLDNSYEVIDSVNSYYGNGIEWLIEEGANAQYFMVGETHGTAEVPKICMSIYSGLAKNGYNHAALEISPFAAKNADKILRKGGYNKLEDYLTSYLGYNSSSFLGWKEEAHGTYCKALKCKV